MTKPSSLIASVALGLAGCGGTIDPPIDAGLDGAPVTGDAQVPDAGQPVLQPVTTPIRFVVHHTDYRSSAFTLLDALGGILVDGYIHSGTVAPGLSAAISGDTDVPSLHEAGVLTVIDRFGTDVITRVDVASGRVIGQVRTQPPDPDMTGFSSNPQDVAYVSATSAWVSRYSHNLVPVTDPLLEGSDLIEIDPSTMQRTGRRVDLDPLERDVAVGGGSLTARVRPRRIVVTGDTMAVGLDLITDGYEAAAPGRLALVSLLTRNVTSFDLAPLVNCGNVARVPNQPTYVAVTCAGYGDVVAGSGIAIVAIDAGGNASLVRRYLSADHPSEPTVFDSVTLLDEDEFLGVHVGGFGPSDPPDVLYHVNMTTGTRTLIHTAAFASALFVTMAYDPLSRIVMVPEVGVGIRRFTRELDGTFIAGSVLTPSGHGLPADAVSLHP